MLAKTLGNVTFYGIVLVMVMLSASGLVMSQVKYDSLISYILHSLNRTDLYEVLTRKYFTPEKLALLKMLSWGVTACSLVLLFVCYKYRKEFINGLQQFAEIGFALYRKFWSGICSNSKLVNRLLFVSMLLILFRSIYFASTFYIQYDEAWNYNYFLHNNIFYSGFAYNNYPLHNIVSWIFVKLFSANTFVLRVPSIIAGILTCLLVFAAIKKIFQNEWLALCSLLIFACLPISVFYMLYARGVMFEMFFSVLIVYFLFTRGSGKMTKRQIIFLAILNALATYSMLSHVYFIGLSTLFLMIYKMIYRPRQIKYLILYLALSIGFSLFLLLPMALGTGLSSGLHASFGNASYLVLHMLPYHCYSDFMTGAWCLFYFLTAVNIILLFLKSATNFKMMIIANLVLLVSPFIIKWSTGIFPPERGLAFLCIIPISSFAIGMEVFKVRRVVYLVGTVLAIFILTFSTYFHTKLNWSRELDMQVFKLATVLMSKEDVAIYSRSSKFNYFVPGVQYYYAIFGRNFNYKTNEMGSSRYGQNADAPCTVTDVYLGTDNLLFSYDSMYIYYKK